MRIHSLHQEFYRLAVCVTEVWGPLSVQQAVDTHTAGLCWRAGDGKRDLHSAEAPEYCLGRKKKAYFLECCHCDLDRLLRGAGVQLLGQGFNAECLHGTNIASSTR